MEFFFYLLNKIIFLLKTYNHFQNLVNFMKIKKKFRLLIFNI